MTDGILPSQTEPGGPLLKTPDHVSPELKFFSSFNPASVAPTFRDILRYLFRTSAPDTVKYTESGHSAIDIRVMDDQEPDHAPGARPVILINRGDYTLGNVAISDNAAEFGLSPQGQQDRTTFMTFARGAANIRIMTWNFGTCELLGKLTMQYLVASKPYICNSQGFKDVGPVAVSRPLRDKDDKDKWIIDIQLPWSLEMHWKVQNIGPRLRGILSSLEETQS